MGNLCSTSKDKDPPQSRRDNFAGPGRSLADAPPRPSNTATAPLPANVKMGNAQSSSSQGQGRTLGDSAPPARTETDPTMRSAAARAAEERMKKSQGTGALGKKLDAQRRQTRTDTLEDASRTERSARTQDAAASSQAYN